MSYNLISIHQPHRSRRTSHDLVLIFPIWSCMSCNKLLQSHLLRHFHYIWTESVSLSGCYMSCILLYASDGWPKFQSIFDGLQSIATDDEKHYLCQNIVVNKKKKLDHYFWNSIGEFNHCLHRWERHSWECRQRHESFWHGTIRLFVSVATSYS